ncbi:MAG: acireductone synthase [Verrucomicrobia bacterium]|nr:acireductone synthase [Verrucomicrobiota bacterium]
MKVYPFSSVKAVLTDIEGTTTSISFVHDVLFPYAKKHVWSFVKNHEADLLTILKDAAEIAGAPAASTEEIIEILAKWMEQDKKITPLKTLQGMMWEDGYQKGDFHGHVYDDAFVLMNLWKIQGLPIYVFSSGSVQAQKLLFTHSIFGDLSHLFSGHFDTKVGGKKEKGSYQNIATQIGFAPETILFLSDTLEELDAAKAAGYQTLLLTRDGTAPAGCAHPAVAAFNQIEIQ